MASISSLAGALGMPMQGGIPGYGDGDTGGTSTTGGTSPLGGGGSATDGLGQIDAGAGTVRSAISTAANALGNGGGGGGGEKPMFEFKKGGYVDKGGKLNLGSGRVSTATKNKSNSNW